MILRNNDMDKAGSFVSDPGDQIEPIYNPKIISDGRIELEATGKRDVQQEIDSWKEHTDMAYILRQMAAGLYQPRSNPIYGDFTDMPDTMAEAMQLMIDAESAFHELPIETQKKFDNNFRKWLMIANNDSDQFSKLMGFVDEKLNKLGVVKSEDVKKEIAEKENEVK